MKKQLLIALVEDNRFHAMLFEQAVLDYFPESTVRTYYSAGEFLKQYEAIDFDLVAVDFHLPDMDGLELLSIIRSEKPDVPIVIITGVGSEQTAVEAMKSGAADYITKQGDYSQTIPRVIKQAYNKQRLIMKNRRLENKAREAEKLEMVTTMTSTLNHEINNPLMAIQGAAELLLDDETLTPESRERLEMIADSAGRIEDITRRMANIITANVRETPVGPMLKLTGRGRCRTRSATHRTQKSN